MSSFDARGLAVTTADAEALALYEAAVARFVGHLADVTAHTAAALALERYAAIVVDYPRDSVALQVAHSLDFKLGNREMLRDRIGEALPHWDATVPGFGYVLGMHAFGLEDNGEYERAEAAAREALQLAPDNAGAIHVITHVMEMQGRARDGIEWLQATREAGIGRGFDRMQSVSRSRRSQVG